MVRKNMSRGTLLAIAVAGMSALAWFNFNASGMLALTGTIYGLGAAGMLMMAGRKDRPIVGVKSLVWMSCWAALLIISFVGSVYVKKAGREVAVAKSEILQTKRKLLYSTDLRAVLNGCQELTDVLGMAYGGDVDPDDPRVPKVIRDFGPPRMSKVSGGRNIHITISKPLSGRFGFDAFGRGYPGSMELIPGLWYFEDHETPGVFPLCDRE